MCEGLITVIFYSSIFYRLGISTRASSGWYLFMWWPGSNWRFWSSPFL